MSKVTGVVEKVLDFKTVRGVMYSIKVNDTLYGMGSNKPKCNVGDTVSFSYTEKGQYKNVDTKAGIEILAGPPAAQQSSGGGGSGYQDKQVVISRQSALNSALQFVEILVAADAVPGVGKTTKVEDKYSILEHLVNEKAEEFYVANMAGQAPAGTAATPKEEWPDADRTD